VLLGKQLLLFEAASSSQM